VEEAKKRQNEQDQGQGSGEFIFRVRGAPGQMRIVKMKKY